MASSSSSRSTDRSRSLAMSSSRSMRVASTLGDVLHGYELNETGPGTTFAPGVSSAGGSGENAQLIEIGGTINRPVSCPADLDRSGAVDVNDLLSVVTGWGPCPDDEPGCPGDADDSGAVDVIDLLMIITTWGPCP